MSWCLTVWIGCSVYVTALHKRGTKLWWIPINWSWQVHGCLLQNCQAFCSCLTVFTGYNVLIKALHEKGPQLQWKPINWSWQVHGSLQCLLIIVQAKYGLIKWALIEYDLIMNWMILIFNPRPLRPKGYCRHLRLSVCPSVCLSVCPSVCLFPSPLLTQ